MQNSISRMPHVTGGVELWGRVAGSGGPWQLIWSDRNLILNGMLREQIRAIAGLGAPTDFELANILFGTNGTPEQATDVAITDPTTAAVTAHSYPTADSIYIEAYLGPLDGNGKTFQEMGLVMANGVVTARKTFSAMAKSAPWEWNPRWTIKFRQPSAGLSTITAVGITHLLKMLGGDDAADQPVNRMQFGTGTAYPISTDLTLQVPITPIKSIIDRTAVGDYQVDLTASLLATEANGFPISEAGLVAVNDELVARANLSSTLNKNADYHSLFTWSLYPET